MAPRAVRERAPNYAASSAKKPRADPFERIAQLCESKGIVWVRASGAHPDDERHTFWPAQCIPSNTAFHSDPRYVESIKQSNPSHDTCVMFFVTCHVAWIQLQANALTWREGVQRGYAVIARSHPLFVRALREVTAYCARIPRYPATWWNEPQCYVMAREYTSYAENENEQVLQAASKRAETERICWARVRGFCYWPAQVLPCEVAANKYPALRFKMPEPNTIPNEWPCMFFGTGELAVVPSKLIRPFITGTLSRMWEESNKVEFIAALGEMWAFLQCPRISLPTLWGRPWWESDDVTSNASITSISTNASTRALTPNNATTTTTTTNSNALVLNNPAPVSKSSPKLPNFTLITESVYCRRVRRQDTPPDSAPSICFCCEPDTNNDEKLACTDRSCFNVVSRYFCTPGCCPAGDACGNLPFHLRRTPKHSPFYTSDGRGWGLRLDEDVKKGQFICAYVGELLDRDELDARLRKKAARQELQYYTMDLNNGWYVDAEYKGGLSRFINSSCAPNCESQKWTEPETERTHVGIFALCDMTAGTEITYNYRQNFAFGLRGSEVGQFECRCGAVRCCTLDKPDRDLVQRYVGSRIKVRWDDGWYCGSVHSFMAKKRKFKIMYDDGDQEELALGVTSTSNNSASAKVAFKLLDDNDVEIS